MKICWDNLERLRYSKNTNRRYLGNSILEYMDSCEGCNESFLAYIRKGIDKRFCSVGCKNKTIPVDVSGKNNPMYGKRHTEDSKRKISENRKGKCTGNDNPSKRKEVRKKISESLKIYNSDKNWYGENNYNWKGGISFEPYCINWVKPFKDEIKERDNFECQNPYCESNNPDDLTAHHIDYNKKNCDTNNLITLCRCCNSKANAKRKYHKELYIKILNEKHTCK